MRAFARLLPHSLFQEAGERAGITLGCSALAVPNLVWLSILAAVHTTRVFSDVLSLTLLTLDLSANGLPAVVARSRKNARRHRPKGSKHVK